MSSLGVSDILESLGLKDQGTSGYQARAIFHYEPLLRLYKLEIPSLFGLLLRHEGTTLNRADPSLFQVELDKMLVEFGPLIWPSPGHGPRDHLLKPTEGSRYTSDLIYPRDKDMLVSHLRSLILSKRARSNVDIEALIEKRHKDAKHRVIRAAEANRLDSHDMTTREKVPESKAGERVAENRQVSLKRSNSEHAGPREALSSDSSDSVIDHSARRRAQIKSVSKPFRIALRLYRKRTPAELQQSGPCHSYGTTFIDNDYVTAAKLFARIEQSTYADCTYVEFHPPEDMSLEGRIRIDQDSAEADETYGRVVSMFREARKFPGEPSHRTIEVEVGIVTPHEQ